MKIVQVCPYDIDRPGGVQTHIRDTAAALYELGHSVSIIAPDTEGRGREVLPDGVEIARFGRARMISLGETRFEISVALGAERRALARFLDEREFDVAHFHTMWTPLLAPQVFLMSRCPAVATFHDTPAETSEGRMLKMLFRLISRFLVPRLSVVITPSSAPQAHLVTPAGRHIETIPPCTNLHAYIDAGPTETPRKDELLEILFLGRLEARKGAPVLLGAYERLKREGLPARLVIAGSGPEEAELRSSVAIRKIPDVEFAGAVSESRKHDLLRRADIFCAPSLHGESFGIVLTEAMACGKPIVAAANSGYSSVLTGEAARFLVPPGDVFALAEALKRLLANSRLRDELGAWGRAEAIKYDCRVVAPRLVELYLGAMRPGSIASRSAT